MIGQAAAMRNRYLQNISSNSIFTALSIGIGMWFSSILANQLGVEGFALISMSVALTTAVSIFTATTNGAISRYLTVSLAKGDIDESNRIFNSTFFSSLAISLLLLPGIFLASFYAPQLFNTNEIELTRIFVFLALISALVQALGGIFFASAFAANRFDIISFSQAFLLAFRFALTAGLLSFWQANLLAVSIGMLVAALVHVLMGLVIWRKLTPELKFSQRSVSRANIKSILGMGFWVSIDAVGLLLITRLNTILVSHFSNLAMAGYYGLYLTLEAAFAALGRAFGGTIQSEVYMAFGKNDCQALEKSLSSGIRLTFTLMSVLAALLIGFRAWFVGFWLGEGYEVLLNLILIGLPITAFSISFAPYLAVLNTQEKTSGIAFATIFSGLGQLVSCLALNAIGHFNILALTISSSVWALVKMMLMVWIAEGSFKALVERFFNYFLKFLGVFMLPLILAIGLGGPVNHLVGVVLGSVPVIFAWIIVAFLVLTQDDLEKILGRKVQRGKIMNLPNLILNWKIRLFSKRL
jgi:O-antigen/teichoic acid export membrane protein